MNVFPALGGGIVAGALGAALWAAISYYLNAEIGWVAWGIGAAVGYCVRLGARELTGPVPAVIAVGLSLLSIAAGKYALIAVHIANAVVPVPEFQDSDAQFHQATQLVQQQTEAGNPPTWPEGKTLENAASLDDFPEEVRQQVRNEWEQMTPAERSAKKDAIRQEVLKAFDGFKQDMQWQLFQQQFGPYDLLWFGLAAFTAWQLGFGEPKRAAVDDEATSETI